jgi:hypothetical protein
MTDNNLSSSVEEVKKVKKTKKRNNVIEAAKMAE